MQCYVCAEGGIDRPAVALCRSCHAGLCLEHLREAAAQFESDNMLAACHHSTWASAGSAHASSTDRPAQQLALA